MRLIELEQMRRVWASVQKWYVCASESADRRGAKEDAEKYDNEAQRCEGLAADYEYRIQQRLKSPAVAEVQHG